ncbi:hypothetical protein Q3G72_026116 [Acer saccharum]|nr:hypothetical protein Q3G72_026116 [Acer saccharum]
MGEEVEDKCNTCLDITTPMVDMQKKAPGEGISTSVNSERSIIVYEKHPPRAAAAVVFVCSFLDVYDLYLYRVNSFIVN